MMDAAPAASYEGRGFANARNAKLHLLAKKKRTQQPGLGAADDDSTEPAASPVRPGRPVRLSDVLKATPQHFDSYKVACVERSLAVLDELPEHYHAAEVVYISKNNLQSLQGIEQFSQLRVLSASDNLLADISQLQILQDGCPNLQVVSFERNPLVVLPNYRNKVIQMLPKLQMLDGQGISVQDRQRAAAALKQEAACMAVMMSNACMVHKLVRTAELLQLHTELRRALFGSAAVLRKSFLPTVIPLDLLRFLKLWDYEGGLSAGDRRIITDALTREVVRVHRQLQHAAVQLKGPAQLPELQAWDAAISQVMLAQQRTIIQLVELVNALHDEAAKVVASLMPHTQQGEARQVQEEQEQLEHQHQQEREGLIADLRDAALELAGVLASNSPPMANGSTVNGIEHYIASPLQLRSMDMSLQQQVAQPHEVQQQQGLQQAAEAQEQLEQQLRRWSPGSQQERRRQQQQQQPTAGTSPAALSQQQERWQQQQQPDAGASPAALSQQQGQASRRQQATSVRGQKPARRLSGNESLRLRPARSSAPGGQPQLQQQQQRAPRASTGSVGLGSPAAAAAAEYDPIVAAASGSGLSPIRPRATAPGSPLVCRGLAAPAQQPAGLTQQQQQEPQQQCNRPATPTGSSMGDGLQLGNRQLSPTAQRLLQQASAVRSSGSFQQQQPPPADDHQEPEVQEPEVQQPVVQLPLQGHQYLPPQQFQRVQQQHAEWMEAGFASDTPQGRRSSSQQTSPAAAAAGDSDVVLFSSPERRVADSTAAQPMQQQQRQSHSSLSHPGSSTGYYDQQQQSVLQQQGMSGRTSVLSQSGSSILQVPEGLPYLAHNNVVYERIERFTPVSAMPGSPIAGAAADGSTAAAAATAGDEDVEQLDVPAMVAAAQTAARQLFAVEGVPGACSFFSPFPTEMQQVLAQDQYSNQLTDTAADSATSLAIGSEHNMGGREISFAYGHSNSSSPELPTSPSRRPAASPPQQQQQPPSVANPQQRQQDQLLRALLSDSDNEASSPSAAQPPAATQQQQLWQQQAVQVAARPEAPAAAAAGPAAASSPLSRDSSVSSDLSGLRQRLFASVAVPSPPSANSKLLAGRPSENGLAGHILAQQQQQQEERQQQLQEQLQHQQQPHQTADDGNFTTVVSTSDLQQQLLQSQAQDHSIMYPTMSLQQVRQHYSEAAVAAAGGNSSVEASVPRLQQVQGQQEQYQEGHQRLQQQQQLSLQPIADLDRQQIPQQYSEALSAAGKQPGSPRGSGVGVWQLQLQAQQQRMQQPNSVQQQAAQQQQPPPGSPVQQQHAGPQQPQQQLLEQQQQPAVQEANASSSSSTMSRVSAAAITQQQQQQQRDTASPIEQAPVMPASSRQSARGVTLDDWNMQVLPQHQGSPQVPESGTQPALRLSDVAAGSPLAAAAGFRSKSPDSGRSSPSSMVELVAQILGPDSSPPPADIAAQDYLNSRANSLSSRASLGLAVASWANQTQSRVSDRPDRVMNAPPATLAEAVNAVGAAVQAAVNSSRPASPRASAAEPHSPVSSRVQESMPASAAGSWACGPGANQPTSPRQVAMAAGRSSPFGSLVGDAAEAPRVSTAEGRGPLSSTVQQVTPAGAMVSLAAAPAAYPHASSRQSAAAAGRGSPFGSLVGDATEAPRVSTAEGCGPLSSTAQQAILDNAREAMVSPGGEACSMQSATAVRESFGSTAPAATPAATEVSPRASTAEQGFSAAVAAASRASQLDTTASFTRPSSVTMQLPAEAPQRLSGAAAAGQDNTATAAAGTSRASQLDSKASFTRSSSATLQHPSETLHRLSGVSAAGQAIVAAAAAAVGPSGRVSGSATPTRKAIADLQGQLVVLAVEKAALEKQVQLGLGEMEHLQHKVAQKGQLEATLYQMQEDLLLAQERLQQAGNAAQQQAQQNQELLLQMQQVQQQLAAQEAAAAQAAAAETLSSRALCRRILLHLHQAVIAYKCFKQLKAAAAQHRQLAVQKGVLRSWRCSAKLSKGLQQLQSRIGKRVLQLGLQAWHQGIVLQRWSLKLQEAAEWHHYTHTAHKVLTHWSYYAYQVKQLGLDVPSSPSTASVASDIDTHWQQQQQEDEKVQQREQQGQVGIRGSCAAVLGDAKGSLQAETSRHNSPSLRSLSVRLSPALRGSSKLPDEADREKGQSPELPQQSKAGRSRSHSVADFSSSGHQDLREEEADLAAAADSVRRSVAIQQHREQSQSEVQTPRLHARQMPSKSASWFDLQQPSSPRHSSAGQSQQHHQQQQQQLNAGAFGSLRSSFAAAVQSPRQRSRSISVAAASLDGPARQAPLRRAALSAVQLASAAAAVEGVPVDVQLTFMGLARAQRVRRRRLLLKAWSRWQEFLEVQAADKQHLAAADRLCRRHRTRRTWHAWQEHVEQQQYHRTHPDGLDHSQLQLLQHYSKFKQQTLLLQLLQAWWAITQRGTAARAAARTVAARKQQQLLRQTLRFMQHQVQYSYHKQQLMVRAEGFRIQQLLSLGWTGWQQIVAAARAADPLRNPVAQQLMWKVILRWQNLAAYALAAAAQQRRIEGFTDRVATNQIARVFGSWRWLAVQAARQQQHEQLQQVKEQVLLLQQQLSDQQQQHGAGMEAVASQMQQLQDQLEAALADKGSADQAAKAAEQQLQEQVSSYKELLQEQADRHQQQLQQQASSHQEQINQLNADHRTTVAVMQHQVEQAAKSTEETAEQLQQLQQQQAAAGAEQQQKQQQMQEELEGQRQQQQQRQQREQELVQQLATSKSQCKQLASQLKRCSEKLNQQTEAVQTLRSELETAQQQVASARHASRDQNLSLTHQALAAERERLHSQQQLCTEHAAVQVLKQQVHDLEQQLQQQQEAATAAAEQHGTEVERLMDQLYLKEQVAAQLQQNVSALQGQLSSQQAKVMGEVEQLRSGWSQAKQIIKQQRKTIKAQERQLQLALRASCTGLVQQSTQQQQQYFAAIRLQEISEHGFEDFGGVLSAASSAADVTANADMGTENEGRYPITGYVLQQQQQPQNRHSRVVGATATAAAPTLAGATNGRGPGAESLVGGVGNFGTAGVSYDSSGDKLLNSLKALKQQHKQQ